MTEPYGTPMPEAPKKNNTMLIVGIAAIVICCCCVVGLGIAWQFGDQIIHALGIDLY
ncbi:MAG: hypothetical protein HFACDABA_00790 [Anaerolineales bacterium]|nr:hypothetical protein [Anaerolineales bacterium]